MRKATVDSCPRMGKVTLPRAARWHAVRAEDFVPSIQVRELSTEVCKFGMKPEPLKNSN